MKRFITSIFLCSLLLLSAFTLPAQTRSRVMPSFPGGSYSVFGTTGYNVSATGTTDTIAVTDSIAYIYPITGGREYSPFISFTWTKIGAGTATLAAKFFEGNQGSTTGNFTAVLAGSANAAYTKSYTLSATGTNYISFMNDSAKISGRYLKIQFYTTSTANVSGSIKGTVNTTLR